MQFAHFWRTQSRHLPSALTPPHGLLTDNQLWFQGSLCYPAVAFPAVNMDEIAMANQYQVLEELGSQ